MNENDKVLIVSGLGNLDEYLFAAAIALRGHSGATLAFSSMQALPEVLGERVKGGFSKALLLGIGLTTGAEQLERAFSALCQAGTKITWISGADFPVPPELPESVRKLFEAYVASAGNLPGAVAEALGSKAEDLLSLHHEPGRTAHAKAWAERIAAAGWSFANSRDFATLESAVRDLADGRRQDQWSPDTKGLLENYRLFGYRRLQTASPAMRRLRKDIARVAKSRAMRVLVTGESGVGKETVAQQIHVQSKRKGPLLAFNCATVTKDLLESRLFGHAKGAFTGATTESPGLFREADGGTLFLDEISELPGELQGVLLRVLQDGRIQPVGKSEETKVDVRVVAATNRDLAALAREGRFRADLYWRLSAVELNVPPLRERVEDFRPLVKDLWKSMAPGRKPLSDADIATLAAWDWPGNVRQLSNVLERAALFEDRTIPELLADEKERSGRLGVGTMLSEGTDTPLEDVVRAHVRSVWERHGRNSSEAARILGISRNTLRAKLG